MISHVVFLVALFSTSLLRTLAFEPFDILARETEDITTEVPITAPTTTASNNDAWSYNYQQANMPMTAAAINRRRLLEHVTNPDNKHPNIDVLPAIVKLKLIPIKIQDLNEKNEVLEITIRLQIVSL